MCLVKEKTKRLRLARLRQDAIALDKSPTDLAATCTDNNLWESLDCPDCFDTMLKFYDWDKIRYLYENCDLDLQWNSYEDRL
jgi:hypothetical protein